MSFKSLINVLFKLSGSQAMPNTKSNVIEVYNGTPNDDEVITYTAADNGYLCVTANAKSDSAEISIQTGNFQTGVPVVAENWGLRTFIPIKKGIGATIGHIGINQLQVRFYHLVGGG